jgi:hypothetical protein
MLFTISFIIFYLYRKLQFHVILNGCETRSLTLKENYTLRDFEYRVLKKVSGTKRENVTGEWRQLHNEDFIFALFTNYYYSDNQGG